MYKALLINSSFRLVRYSVRDRVKMFFRQKCSSTDATADDGELVKCAIELQSSDPAVAAEDFQDEWRRIGRFCDWVFSLVFLGLFLLSPLVIAAIRSAIY